MTKVILDIRNVALTAVLCVVAHGFLFAAADADSTAVVARPGEALYLQLGQVGLDPNRVYKVRDATIERPAIHISLEDGTIAFTQDVMGRITGAFFEGEGEILLTPPNEVERRSLSLFTGAAIVEERFATGYFRFNDDTAAELQSGLRPPDNAAEFVSHWSATARNLAHADAMRLLLSFSRLLPAAGTETGGTPDGFDPGDRMLHARLQGIKQGIFDVYFDSAAGEQVAAAQAGTLENGDSYYDVWTSFSVSRTTGGKQATSELGAEPESAASQENPIAIRSYWISTDVTPPKQIHSEGRLQIEVKQGGSRTLLFELSRFLQVERVEMNGHPVEFIHNPAMEGTQLSRQGNDLVAIVLPEPARTGQKIELRFVYGGEVLAEAGGGLLYVGARGTWYPNRGMAMADFDLEFRYPPGWTLVATGKPVPLSEDTKSKAQPQQLSHWTSDRPIPVAGFNLGKYKMARTQAAGVVVETYATANVEKTFPSAPTQVVGSDINNPRPPQEGIRIVVPNRPSPASNEAGVAAEAAEAIEYYAARFGPFPYSRLSLTQMPGRESQGWPGLVFLSSYAFLTDDERAQIRQEPVNILMQDQIPAHETAHQWWGDLITWSTYRDQWFSEGLANYCSLMMLQAKNPAGFRQIMERYRRDLVEKNKDGLPMKDDGPVTLGTRLLSSKFPDGYDAISYGRGTWLFHMLRTMLQDGAIEERHGRVAMHSNADEPFTRALRKIRERYQGKAVTTAELFAIFAEDLPPALRYNGKSSLQWFVDDWVNGTALPRLELKAVKIVPKGQGVMVSGTIVQKDAPQDFVTSVPVYAHLPNRTLVLLGRVFADGEESSFRLTGPSGTHQVVLDPNETILTGPK
ncbi:MAG TPA: M1 family aminopeptidase [Candidatus Sulfotelmatobacter sp.]